jgi:hypothetical protein
MTTVLVCLLAALATALWPSAHEANRLLTGRASTTGTGGSRGRDPSAGTTTVPSPLAFAALGARWAARRSDQASTDEVADALVLISVALRAGLPLSEALHHVHAEATGHVRADLAAVAAALRWGRPAH